MGADGSAGFHCHVLAVGQERGWLFCASVSFLPAVSVALLSEVVCLSFSAEREEPDAGSHYGYGHCVQRPERNDAGRRFVLFCS